MRANGKFTPLALGPERLLGVGLIKQPDSASDRMVGSMPTGRQLLGPDNRPAVGALGVLVDNALGFSSLSTLPAGSWTVSTEIWLDVLSPLDSGSSRHYVEGRTLVAGAFATGQVTDGQGGLLAVARQRNRLVSQTTDDLITNIPSGVDVRTDGDVLRLLGVETLDATSVVATCGPELQNVLGMMHGGISLAISEIAATWSRVQAGSNLATSSVHVIHSLPVPAGSDVVFTATTRRSGQRFWVTDVEAVAEGKPCVIAQVSAHDQET